MKRAGIDVESMTLGQLRELFYALFEVLDRRWRHSYVEGMEPPPIDYPGQCRNTALALECALEDFLELPEPRAISPEKPIWELFRDLCDTVLVDLSRLADRRSLAAMLEPPP